MDTERASGTLLCWLAGTMPGVASGHPCVVRRAARQGGVVVLSSEASASPLLGRETTKETTENANNNNKLADVAPSFKHLSSPQISTNVSGLF